MTPTKNAKSNRDLIQSLYRNMVLIREFELKAREVFRTGRMPGFIHVYIGEEAVATGVCAQLRVDDYVASTHRGHGHALAKGVTPREAMAELLGAVTGCSGGRGGTTTAAGGHSGGYRRRSTRGRPFRRRPRRCRR